MPSLGGQPVFYLTVQLVLFRERLRAVEQMNNLMRGFSDGDLRRIADLIAKLPPPPPAGGPIDPDRMERGQALAEQNR